MSNTKLPVVPVFFGCDERFAKYMATALKSLINCSSAKRHYEIHILHTDITEETMNIVKTLAKENVSIEFDDVSAEIADIISLLPVRDYYSASTYYRLVIASKFQQYDKALYIDSDVACVKDVAKLFDTYLSKNKYVAAVPEAVMAQLQPAGEYAEKVVGVNRYRYFNAGILVINCKAWREHDVLGQFCKLVNFYDFKVAQDQDYLNVICKGHVHFLPRRWNMECIKTWKIGEKDRGIIHYAFAAKPWNDINSPYSQYFWKAASMTPFYAEIKTVFANTTQEMLDKSAQTIEGVMKMCNDEISRPDNFLKKMNKQKKKEDEDALEHLLNSVVLPVPHNA